MWPRDCELPQMSQRLTATVPRILATILNETIVAGMVVLLHRCRRARLVPLRTYIFRTRRLSAAPAHRRFFARSVSHRQTWMDHRRQEGHRGWSADHPERSRRDKSAYHPESRRLGSQRDWDGRRNAAICHEDLSRWRRQKH